MKHTKKSDNKMIKSQSSSHYEHLDDFRNLVNKICEPNFARKDWARLFCRQLIRLQDYNKIIPDEIWTAMHRDLLYIVMDSNAESNQGEEWEEFLERMNCESKLEQRELQFNITFKERKSFSQLFGEDKDFFIEYFQKCIFLHSKVQVRGLIKNIDNLLSNIYGLTEVDLISESQKRLEEKLKCIEINLDSSNKSLNPYQYDASTSVNPSNRINNNPSTFLPSVEQTEMINSDKTMKISNLLRYNRWIVIRGDPGSAKTTLLRWITCIFAEAALHNDEEVILEGKSCLPLRIPILIRIGEFASWLTVHKTETLIDYIGKHTWFSERYCPIGSEYKLKELVYHGHALILLDGLDEIPEIGRRGQIVDLVEKFIAQYVRGPEFFSAFDHCTFESVVVLNIAKPKLIEVQPPKKCGGNQIVVTSRIVGYHLYPLIGLHIKNYLLLLMNYQQAEEFAKNWTTQVEKCIFDHLLNEGIQIDQETKKVLLKKRDNAVKKLFENNLGSLTSNPSLLSLICMSIFQSSDEFRQTSRVEVYYHTVQAALQLWRSQKSSISESILTNFLIELANYLHLQSPSGLIDVFDMKHLCCLVLRHQGVSNNRKKLRAYANKLISVLNSNVGIVDERGLQVFGFIHLSLQEYFVAQGLVRGSSIDEIVKRIVTFTINPRFRESLLLAIGWISWKWSFDDYNKFCNLLITPSKDYEIPVGTLIFFDAFDDMIRWPSKLIIFTALNNLLNHPSGIVRLQYLLWNLSQLSDDIIIEWMELYLKDDKYLFNFCQCFITNCSVLFDSSKCIQTFTPIVYQKLWSFHNRSISTEFVIDQALRKGIISNLIFNQTFNKKLSFYIFSRDPSRSDIHPLILAAIVALCGGAHSGHPIGRSDIIYFSPKYMHRECSILDPIVKYLNNNQETHSIKIQIVINSYQNFLEQSLPSDTSIDIVDTFIALIGLQGLSQPSNYQKYKEYKALPLALERFKCIWFYLNQLWADNQIGTWLDGQIYFIENKIKPIMNMFYPQADPSDEQFSSFSLACATAFKKIRRLDVTNKLNFSNTHKIDQDLHFQSDFILLIDEKQLDLIAQNIPSLNILQKKPFFLLNFLPQSLQQLYSCTIIFPINKKDSLPLVVFLSQCLTHLEDVDDDNANFYLALVILQPLLKEHMLENYASALLWETYFGPESKSSYTREFLEAMNKRKLFDPFSMDHHENLELFIKIECQRIYRTDSTLRNQDEDVRLFSAIISLARLYQTRYRFRKYKTIKHIGISRTESDDIHFGIMNILNPVLRIIVLNILLNMKDPLIFIDDQRDKLQWQLFWLLYCMLPHIPLLTSTLLFVQCYSVHQFFPVQFEYMANIIGQKLNETSIDKQNQGQEVAYIALKHLNDSDLSPYLSQFAKGIVNLSDVLHFNSTIFYDHFTKITSFGSLNCILLSIMYLNELNFDVQNLKIYTGDDYKNNVSPLKHLNKLSKTEKIMSFKVATWITDSLQKLNKKEIQTIIEYISRCSLIEKHALSVMEKWLDYRRDKDFKIFAQYAALQLIIEGFNNSDLMDIINDLFLTDAWLSLISIVELLFNSQLVNSSIFRQILVLLQANFHYSSELSVLICCKKNFELILNLEYEQITANACPQTKPFLLMIKACSTDLQFYLNNYIYTFIIDDIKKEIYIAIVIKWIIEKSILHGIINGYNYIFTLLHDQRFPQVQKAIINGLNSVYSYIGYSEKNIFLQDDVINSLEEVICSWVIYSRDVIDICLLAYGNYLCALKEYKRNRNVSDEMKNMLSILSETSSPESISIRATFCLGFLEESNIQFSTTLDWFSRWNVTPKDTYDILLDQILYREGHTSITHSVKDFAEYLDKHSDDFMGMFVTDLYNYMCNKNNRNYLSDPSPDYVMTAIHVSRRNWNKFLNAVKKSSFGEKKFKTAIVLYYINNPVDDYDPISFYMYFGSVTAELVDMMERYVYSERGENNIALDGIKQVSVEYSIEKMFQVIASNLSDRKYTRYMHVLRILAKLSTVSLLEIHQRFSQINIMSYDDDDECSDRKKEIFDLLLDMSCFERTRFVMFDNRFFTQNEIGEEFSKEIKYLDKNSALVFRENPFCIDFSSVPN